MESDVADDTDSFAGSDVFKRHARRAHGMHFTDGWPVQVGDSPAGASEEESARAARCSAVASSASNPASPTEPCPSTPSFRTALPHCGLAHASRRRSVTIDIDGDALA